MTKVRYSSELYHHGIKGQKWGVRRYQNEDGTLTPEGKLRYRSSSLSVDCSKKNFSSDAKNMLSSLYAMNPEQAVNAIYDLEHGAEYNFSISDNGSKRAINNYWVNTTATKPYTKIQDTNDRLARDIKERYSGYVEEDDPEYAAKLDRRIQKSKQVLDNYGRDLVKIAEGIRSGKYDKHIDKEVARQVSDEMTQNIKRIVARDRANRTTAVVLGAMGILGAAGLGKYILYRQELKEQKQAEIERDARRRARMESWQAEIDAQEARRRARMEN